jgi:imidazolonepropionase-like amidohydrolase
MFAVRGVRLFDGDMVVEDATVLVNGDTIEEVGTGVAIPAGAAVIEGQGKTLLPGLIDAHAHIWTGESSLEQALVVGVTTELIMAGPPAFARQMKEQPRVSPRADVFSAGHAMTAPHGHGTQFGGNVPTLAAGADGAAFANARMDEGSDFLKIIYDHWKPTVSPEQIRTAAQAAGARGKLAVAHVSTADEASTAVHAGVDGLVHLWWKGHEQVAPQTLDLMARRGTFVIPTLEVAQSICGHSRAETIIADPALSPYIAAPALASLRTKFTFPPLGCGDHAENVRSLRKRGITILAGTDSPVPGVAHGVSLHDELVLLQEAGLTPLEVLAAATSRTADAFSIPDRGRIAPGKLADLVLVTGDPTRDVRAARNISAIWKNGWPVPRAEWAEKVARERTAHSRLREHDGRQTFSVCLQETDAYGQGQGEEGGHPCR